MDDTTLTTKQLLFVEYYLGDARFNATEAARRAGYMGDSHTLQTVGSQNLKKPAIAARIRERVAEVMMSADECMLELSALARQPLHETLTIKRDHRGEVVDARFDAQAKLRALELIGKRHSLFSDKVDVNHTSDVLRIIEYAPPPMLRARIEQGDAEDADHADRDDDEHDEQEM